MEFKTVFYIVVGLAWFIWKGLESSRQHKQQRPVIKPPVAEPAPGVRVTHPVQFKPQRSKQAVNYEEVNPGFREGGSVRADFGTNEENLVGEEGISYAQQWSERWKSGEIDIRDAVVFSELMRPVHIRS